MTLLRNFPLGIWVWLDYNLSMGDHITETSSVARSIICRRIRKYLSKEYAVTLIHAFISSRIDFCNSLLYELPACQLQKLQGVQNSAVRLCSEKANSVYYNSGPGCSKGG